MCIDPRLLVDGHCYGEATVTEWLDILIQNKEVTFFKWAIVEHLTPPRLRDCCLKFQLKIVPGV